MHVNGTEWLKVSFYQYRLYLCALCTCLRDCTCERDCDRNKERNRCVHFAQAIKWRLNSLW